MRHSWMIVTLAIAVLLAPFYAHAQGEPEGSVDTSGAQAALKAMQASAQHSAQPSQTFSALRAESCKVAIPYVESKQGLIGEWDRCMSNYVSAKIGASQIQEIKSELLSETWWARSSGPDVARNVSTLCNLLTDVYAAMTPTGEALDFARGFGTAVRKRSAQVFQTIQYGSGAMDAIHDGTDGLAIWAAQDQFKRVVGGGQFLAVIDVLRDVQRHAANVREGEEFKRTVQVQLQKLDEMLNKFGNDMTLDRERLEALESIKDAVVSAYNSGQPIESVSAVVGETAGATQDAPLPSMTTPAMPWWVTALNTPVRVPPHRGTAQSTRSTAQQPGASSGPTSTDHAPGHP